MSRCGPAVVHERAGVGEDVSEQHEAGQHHHREELDLLRGLVDAPLAVHHAQRRVAHGALAIALRTRLYTALHRTIHRSRRARGVVTIPDCKILRK